MDHQDDAERFGISELAEAAGISVRTVRYYIAEGLLPPPVAAGARSHYSREHLDRLRLIGQLKEAYLPLREIRRHLTELDHAQVQQMTRSDPGAGGLMAEPVAYSPQTLPPARSEFLRDQERILPNAREPDAPGSAADYIRRVLGDPRRRHGERPTRPRRPPAGPAAPATDTDPVSWRRIEVADGAELLIREDLYQRRNDKIEWLANWARTVLE